MRVRDGWRDQQAWHRDLPETLPNNPKVDPPTRENLLAERSANHVAESVERTAREAVEVDHVAKIDVAIDDGWQARRGWVPPRELDKASF